MKVLTLNTWQKRGPWEERWKLAFEELIALAPDILALQEVFDYDWAEEIQRRTDLPEFVAFQESSGLVLLSRYPVLERELFTYRQKSPTEDYLRYAAAATLRTPSGPLGFFNTHLSYRPEDGAVREGQVRELLSIIDRKAGGRDVLVTGDFNAAPDTPEIRQMLEQGRFTDAYGSHHPEDKGFTWCHRNPYTLSEHNKVGESFLPERRIDYIFFRRMNVLSKLRSVQVVLDQPSPSGVWSSDHFGVLAEFEVSDSREKAADE